MQIKNRFKVDTKKGTGDLKPSANGPVVLVQDVERMMKNAMTAVKQASKKAEDAIEASEQRLHNARTSGVTEYDLQKLQEWYEGLEEKPEGFPVEIFDSFGGMFDVDMEE